jgi:hypothetical protein
MKLMQRSLALLALMIAPMVWSHHSTAGYDVQKSMTVTGTVKKFYWTNPHMFVYLQVPNEQGDGTTEWVLEVGAPGINARMGWKSTDIKTGDKITVEFHPSRDGRLDGFAMIVYLANGEKRYCPGYDFGHSDGPPS